MKRTIRRRLCCLLPALMTAGTIAATPPAAESGIARDFEWCSVTAPASFTPGSTLYLTITLHEDIDPGNQQLACHLHWLRPNGTWGGFLSWAPGQKAVPGKPLRFRHRPGVKPESMGAIQPIVFLSPDGDFKRRTRTLNLPAIPIGDPEKYEKAVAQRLSRLRPETATLRKSSLRILPPEGPVTKGEPFTVRVETRLDPSDTWGEGTKLELMPLGPWVDNPDGTYTTKRQHHGIPGLRNRTVSVAPGTTTNEFTFTIKNTFRYNDIAWLARFKGADGKNWPWDVRASGPVIRRAVRTFDLRIPADGGLFTYAEQPRVELLWDGTLPEGSDCEIAFRVINVRGETVASFTRTVPAGTPETPSVLALPALSQRGTFLLLAEMGGQTRETFFATIPDVPAAERRRGRRTPFGVTNLSTPATARAARKLGAAYCRLFTNWNTLEPLPGQFRFDALDQTVETCRAADITPWILLCTPPAWVLTGPSATARFEPFPFDADAWENTATALARRYRGKIWGFEWLNEIVPGNKCADPVADYLAFCEIGTRAVRAVDPALKIQLAGGLWPLNFRNDLLQRGIAKWIDVLPVHYGAAGSVREARANLAAVGKADAVEIWDNETAAGYSVWKMPPVETLTNSVFQCRRLMRQWPGELTAGAKKIIYFGGSPAAAGNWTYLLDENTPRPVAATCAVLAEKIGLADPVAAAWTDEGVELQIFSTAMVAGPASDAPDARATLSLPVGTNAVTVADFQGNSVSVPCKNNTLTLELGSMPVIIEGFHLPTVAVHAGVIIGTGDANPNPRITAVEGAEGAVLPVRVLNPLPAPVSGSVTVTLGSFSFPAESFTLDAGASRLLELPFSKAPIPEGTRELAGSVTLRWDLPGAKPAACSKAFGVSLIRPEHLGNLLENSGFERTEAGKPAAWGGRAESFDLAALGTGPGFDGHAARFSGETVKGYQHMSQQFPLPTPGRSYLYTAWVWNGDMQAGSNLSIDKKDYYIVSVFDAGRTNGFWKLMSHVRATPPTAKTFAATPVVRGDGWALYDNLRVTIYEGTPFVTEARRAAAPPAIDGDLSDWDFTLDPVPLLCENQLTAAPGYDWSPANLSAVARLQWDEQALYLAVKVRDDVHQPGGTGEQTLRGDALRVALHPGNRTEGTDGRAFEWDISASAPGGGSGRHTLYRPPARNGGLPSGQLAKDSSVYELAVKREGDITAYELRIPWSETGGLTPAVGTRAGLSLQLFDTDDNGLAPSVMTWGGGLLPEWAPSAFGLLTLID